MQIFRRNRWQWLFSLGLSVMLLLIISNPVYATNSAQQDMQRLDTYIEQALTQAEAKQLSAARTVYDRFDQQWFDIEDGVKESSRQAYRDIEEGMGEVKYAFSVTPSNPPQVVQALKKLHGTNQKFIRGGFSSGEAQTPPTATPKLSIATLISRLDRAQAALDENNVESAAREIQGFQTDWVEVEGFVKAKSQDAYGLTENTMAKASALLRSSPPHVAEAQTAIAQLKQTLEPFASQSLRYTLFDSAVILLREGLEALLVIVALLAFLVKSGNADKGRWIWIGAGAGLVASLMTAVMIQLIFANIPIGTNRELLEGITGLVAAVMLFYVSYWLHSKSSLNAWQGYIRDQTTAALKTNSVFSLALLAGLAVFREGAETVLFYMGIAPSISTSDLLGGLSLGALILTAIAGLMLGLGLKIPIKPFFLVTSVLIYYLGFKFVGNGIHALQVAGILPANTANFLPSVDGIGLYPTWETTLPQLALIVAAIAVVLYTRSQTNRAIQGDPS